MQLHVRAPAIHTHIRVWPIGRMYVYGHILCSYMHRWLTDIWSHTYICWLQCKPTNRTYIHNCSTYDTVICDLITNLH